jgi:hypothetical protein
VKLNMSYYIAFHYYIIYIISYCIVCYISFSHLKDFPSLYHTCLPIALDTALSLSLDRGLRDYLANVLEILPQLI